MFLSVSKGKREVSHLTSKKVPPLTSMEKNRRVCLRIVNECVLRPVQLQMPERDWRWN